MLVAAVDDLRCEVEWQAKQIAMAELTGATIAPPVASSSSEETKPTEVLPTLSKNDVANDSLLTAAGKLRACEQLYSQGLRGSWSDEWAERDDFEMPVGRVVQVDADICAASWTSARRM